MMRHCWSAHQEPSHCRGGFFVHLFRGGRGEGLVGGIIARESWKEGNEVTADVYRELFPCMLWSLTVTVKKGCRKGSVKNGSWPPKTEWKGQSTLIMEQYVTLADPAWLEWTDTYLSWGWFLLSIFTFVSSSTCLPIIIVAVGLPVMLSHG